MRWLLIAIAAVTAAVIGGLTLREELGPTKVTVPRVVGLEVVAAERRLATNGLQMTIDAAGTLNAAASVVDQHPPAGDSVRPGTTVTVTSPDGGHRADNVWEDFEEPTRSYFEANRDATGETRMVDGALELSLPERRGSWWEIDDFDRRARVRRDATRVRSKLAPTGARVTVDAHRLSGSSYVSSGLVCVADGGELSYTFLVDGGSYFALFRSDRDKPLLDWTSSYDIDDRVNVLALECTPSDRGRGVELTIWANDSQLGRVTDRKGFIPSFFGVVVENEGRKAARLRFDNLTFQRRTPTAGASTPRYVQPVAG